MCLESVEESVLRLLAIAVAAHGINPNILMLYHGAVLIISHVIQTLTMTEQDVIILQVFVLRFFCFLLIFYSCKNDTIVDEDLSLNDATKLSIISTLSWRKGRV
ncbi:uncharacterized protein LOC111478517 isoform X2 [Cucurbita maxima]|uniref:Uncharacterized protein LOC111478517 isoform X2 n=1 Tax=Cucurbita maxima TaxID=3661 RepID=A0A6J1IUF1_CUCMA|nr:uncharacterized protein LOC111478517 isoform X2 [Cucurbita maxima]